MGEGNSNLKLKLEHSATTLASTINVQSCCIARGSSSVRRRAREVPSVSCHGRSDCQHTRPIAQFGRFDSHVRGKLFSVKTPRDSQWLVPFGDVAVELNAIAIVDFIIDVKRVDMGQN